MKKKIINIHVVVAYNAREYFDYLIKNFRHTAENPERIFFFCYALDTGTYEHFKNDSRISGCYKVYRMRGAYRLKTLADWKVFLRAKLSGKSYLGGSNGHAAGLNRAMQNLKNITGHNILADSDVAMLAKNWDSLIESHFESYDVIGTPYEPIGGFSSGVSKVQTYKDFPNPIWLAVKNGSDISKMDWMPLKEKNIQIETPETSALYNLPMGYEVVCDVGWRFPLFCSENGLNAMAFQQIKPSSEHVQVLRTGKDYNEEYQLNGKALVGHQRGGSRHKFRNTEISSQFYDCVENEVGTPK